MCCDNSRCRVFDDVIGSCASCVDDVFVGGVADADDDDDVVIVVVMCAVYAAVVCVDYNDTCCDR